MAAPDCFEPKRYGHLDSFLGSDLFYSFIRSVGRGDALHFAQSLFDGYGKTFIASVFGRSVLNTMEAENIHVVLSSTDHFAVAPVRQEALKPLMGKAIFTSDGPAWNRSRSLIKPIVAKAHSPIYSASFYAHVQHLLDRVPRDGSTVDLQPLFRSFFLDTFSEFLFGKSTNTLTEAKSDVFDVEQFLSSLQSALQACGTRMFMGKFSFLLGPAGAMKRSCKNVHDAIDKLVEDALQNRQKKTSDTFLDMLMESTQDRVEIRYQVLNILLPGYDSNALGLSQIFFQLARNPDVWSKLREEIMTLDQSQTLTFKDVRSLKYFRCVVTECFRLIAPFAMNIRRCTVDTVLPSGGGPEGRSPISIRKGTEINMVYLLTQKDPDIWGEDAAQFRPERWEDPDLKPLACEYMPFSAGKRVCPGQQMAWSECSYVLARFVQAFVKIENRDPEGKECELYMYCQPEELGIADIEIIAGVLMRVTVAWFLGCWTTMCFPSLKVEAEKDVMGEEYENGEEIPSLERLPCFLGGGPLERLAPPIILLA
ncbi:hypothetical protein MMC13_001044 [Lambiella insularis]|nr:hypothetical protein [Lambiella insularis]